MVEQTGSSFRNSIFEKALEASITCNLLGICIIRMIPKPSKNGSAFYQKAIKIQAWRHQNRGLEGSGAGLEASWAILGHPGRFWKRLGPSWKRLWGVLEASWAVLGRKRLPTWLQVGSQNGAKIYKKSIPKSINCLMPLRIVIFLFFFDFWNQKPNHVGSKMHSKIDFILTNPESPKLL